METVRVATPLRKAPPDLSAKLAFLRRPDSYPGAVQRVEAIETHMAWVFLAGDRAYKFKKPVRYPFLDYSTLEARRRICHEEVRLNRRLAPDVYLGVVPLSRPPDGTLRIGEAGTPVEWLIAMRRLPRQRMLDHVVRRGAASADVVAPAASLLAAFFAEAAAEPMAPRDYVHRLSHAVLESRRTIAAYVGGPDALLAGRVAAALTRFLDERPSYLEDRARERRIVEGHGDLRPEHVFVGSPPAVMDCIEFNRRFRLQDPVDELVFLAVELERLGAPELGTHFLGAYVERTGDEPPALLLSFYAAYRALLRARIAIEHLSDGGVDPKRWLRLGHGYLEIADRYADRLGDSAAPPSWSPRTLSSRQP
jgi:aminoglycoside phosphotransferase family enzyme